MKTNSGIKIVLGLLLLLPGLNLFCQVGIGPGSFTPNASAGLDIDFTDKGLLVPRVDLSTAFPSIAANAAGLMVYNTNAAFGSGTGFYYNTSNTTVPNWLKFVNITGSGSSAQVSFWDSENSISGDNNLVWKNTHKRLGIGVSSPVATLHIRGSLSAALLIDPFGVSSGNTGELRFCELAANGTNYSGFKAQDVLGANMIWSLPAADGTDGQVLSTNGSGVMEWADNNAITGTGSSGKVAYWSGTNALTYNTNLQWDNTNSRLGIGTASPNATFHIKGNINAALQIDPFGVSSGNTGELRFCELAANGTNYTGFKARDVLGANMIWSLPAADGANGQVLSTNGSGILGWADNNEITGSGSLNEIAFWNGTNVLSHNTNLYWDNTNSRLGIGTASPNANARLDVNSTSLYSGYFTTNSSSDNAHVIHSEYTGTSIIDPIAVYGKSVPTTSSGIGGSFEGGEYGGYFTGGLYGFYSEGGSRGGYIVGGSSTTYGLYVDGNDNAGTSYGITVYANGAGGSSHYGMYTSASGATNNYGIHAAASSGTNSYGIYATASTGTGTAWAGYFSGDVNITGTLSKGGGSFKIDHPQDPENKFLYHSFVESPEMKNVYDGVAVLDENGTSTVGLPSYFEALNKDFRYQLTAIGAPGPNLYIAGKVHDNAFKIAGGTPGMEVSWQVTGIRKDPFAEKNRIPVEADKTADERGKYLYPAAYGLPEEKAIDFENNKSVSED